MIMLDLDYIDELFQQAQGRARKREWYGLGFQIVRRPPGGPIGHCGICGLPWWWHERWGCRAAQPMPEVRVSITALANRERSTVRKRRYRLRRKALLVTARP